jgi:hypothetical protein
MSDKVLQRLQDSAIKKRYQQAIRPASRLGGKIARREAVRLMADVLSDTRLDEVELADLSVILAWADLDEPARRYIEKVLRKRQAHIIGAFRSRLRGDELEEVADCLCPRNVARIEFTNPLTRPRQRYHPSQYAKVRELLLGRQIKVYRYQFGPYWDAVGDAILKGRGRYDSRSNEMLLPADVLMTPLTPSWVARDALVVHEATHAIQDWSDLTMDAASVEADACVAQAIALLTQGGWVDQENLLRAALLGPASMIYNRPEQGFDEEAYREKYEHLCSSIHLDPMYRRNLRTKKVNFGGDPYMGRAEREFFESLSPPP